MLSSVEVIAERYDVERLKVTYFLDKLDKEFLSKFPPHRNPMQGRKSQVRVTRAPATKPWQR